MKSRDRALCRSLSCSHFSCHRETITRGKFLIERVVMNYTILTRVIAVVFTAPVWFLSLDIIEKGKDMVLGLSMFAVCTFMLSVIALEAINNLRN